ncbi:hypothetical protein SFR_0600 [Streptomyces sp. FR-008]|nr:hypothetical protein SFR_0600 [Streptomyces sp. FR-008]
MPTPASGRAKRRTGHVRFLPDGSSDSASPAAVATFTTPVRQQYCCTPEEALT